MELSIHQEALIHLLKKYELERQAIVLISLMLSKTTKGIEAFIYVAHHAQIMTQEEFLRLAIVIAEDLPPEEQVGIPMN